MTSPGTHLPTIGNDSLKPVISTMSTGTPKRPRRSIYGKRSYLTCLPQELLDRIVHFAVVQQDPITIQCERTTRSATRAHHWTGPGKLLSLAKVSRRLYTASIPPFYERNRFIVRTKHDNCPLADLFRTQNIKRATSITLSLEDPSETEWHALLNLENLRLLKLYFSKYNNNHDWPSALQKMQKFCQKLKNLRHIEIVAQSHKFTGLNEFSFGSQNWSAIELVVTELRSIMQQRDPEACVHLREILLYARHIEGLFFDRHPVRKKIRLYAALGVYIFVSQDAFKDRRAGDFFRWYHPQLRPIHPLQLPH